MLGGIDLGKRKNTYIFAPEQKKGGNLGCLFTIVALIAAVVAAAILFNSAANDRMELRTEKVTVMALDKAYEGLTVLHISDLACRGDRQRLKHLAQPAVWKDLPCRCDERRHGG